MIGRRGSESTPARPTLQHGSRRRGLRAIRLLVVPMASLALGLLTPAAAAATQPADPMYRIGFIGFHSPGLEHRIMAYFQERLGELGYVDGRNASIAYRWADGKLPNDPSIAADLARSRVDVIVTPCGPIVRAIRELDATIPLVVRSVDIETCEGEIDNKILEGPGPATCRSSIPASSNSS